jgi:hypothetical protein
MVKPENTQGKKSKSIAISSSGYAALIIGGLIAKFSLVMWLGVIGYTLILFGLVVILAFNE